MIPSKTPQSNGSGAGSGLYYHQVPGIVGDSVFEYHVPPEIIFRNHVDPGGGYPGQLLLDGNYTQRQQNDSSNTPHNNTLFIRCSVSRLNNNL